MAAIVPNRPKNQFNLLSQARRQPGSTFKTFVLAAAVEQGVNPDSTYYVSAPFTYRSIRPGTATTDVVVREDVRERLLRLELDPECDASLGQLGLRTADARRHAEKVAEVARRMGVRSQLDVNGAYVPAIGLGSIAVSPLDIASAYATLAAGACTRSRWRSGGSSSTTAPWTRGPAGEAEAPPGDLGRYRGDRHAHPRAEHPVGNGHARGLRPTCRGQDRDGRAERRRLVRRLHARARDAVWMGYTRAEIPLDSVHGIAVTGGASRPRCGGSSWSPRSRAGAEVVPGAEGVARVEAVHAGRVRALVRPERRPETTETERPRRRRPGHDRPSPPGARAGTAVPSS